MSKPKFKVGQSVRYTFWGTVYTATIVRIGARSGILFMDNGHWMFPQSCEIVL